MKNRTHILILFLVLIFIPINTVLACGISSDKEKMEKISYSKEASHSDKKSCCDNDNKFDNDCGRNCDNNSCHCSSTVNIPVFFNDFELSNANNLTLLFNDWAYVQHFPKAVYLSIWQPPKIS